MSATRKVALVTGASGGIGAGIARALAAKGHKVAVHFGTNADAANTLVAEIVDGGGSATTFQADLAKTSDIAALFAAVEAAFGGIDIFVNNAGIAPPASPIAETDEATYDRVMATNAKAMFFAMQQALRRLRDGGRIVNISSSTTQFPTAGLSLYTASKTMAKTLTEIGALEAGPRGITVNTVVPGPTIPGMFEWAPEGFRAHAASLSPFNRLGTPQDIADVVSFFASDEARWITGQHILVNGGATI